MLKLVKELAALHGPSGFEQPVVQFLLEKIKETVDEIKVDSHGNIIATKKGTAPGPKVIITAHMDEVGFIIRKIENSGVLKVEQLGGHDERMLPGQKVQIRTKNGYLTGIFGSISAHYRKFEKQQVVKGLRDSYIDIGASSKEEAEYLGVTVGDPVTWYPSFELLGNKETGLIVGKGFDDRAGCAVLVKVLEELRDFNGEVIAIFTVQEEIGLRGAKIASEGIDADVTIAVDTTAASDTPDAVLDDILKIGKGTGIKVMDASLVAHPAVRESLTEVATIKDIPHQFEVFPGIGTDGGAIHMLNKGIPTGVLSIPSRNAHSPVEVISIQDLTDTKELLKEFILSLRNDTIFTFIK